MNPDPKIDCAGAPVVVLAGREWFVPVLAMRQARVVVPGGKTHRPFSYV